MTGYVTLWLVGVKLTFYIVTRPPGVFLCVLE